MRQSGAERQPSRWDCPFSGMGPRGVIYSGLDWSGSPGREQGPWLVFAVVHVGAADLTSLDSALADARRYLGRDPDYAFRHSRAKSFLDVHRRFYEAIGHVPWHGHVHMLDKAAWSGQRVKGSRGTDCICDGLVALVIGCPIAVVAHQVLFIDLPPAEESTVQSYRMAMRKSLKGIRRTGFKNVRPCPDHRQQGAIIQVADMIAGEVREHGGLAGPFLPGLRSRLSLV